MLILYILTFIFNLIKDEQSDDGNGEEEGD